MKKEKKEAPEKKFSLDDFKAHAKTISSNELLDAITGGIEDACHVLTPAGGGSGGGSHTRTGPY